jgi:hypothetical protein
MVPLKFLHDQVYKGSPLPFTERISLDVKHYSSIDRFQDMF